MSVGLYDELTCVETRCRQAASERGAIARHSVGRGIRQCGERPGTCVQRFGRGGAGYSCPQRPRPIVCRPESEKRRSAEVHIRVGVVGATGYIATPYRKEIRQSRFCKCWLAIVLAIGGTASSQAEQQFALIDQDVVLFA